MLPLRQLFLQHVAQTSDEPLGIEVACAQGVYITDVQGKKYIDLIAGIGVSAVGHCHPEVTQSIENQVHTYMHLMVYGEYIQTPQVQLSAKIAGLMPDGLDNVYLVNSGTEATEAAIKLAKRHTQRTQIISFENAYHGSTNGALSIMGSEFFKTNYRPLMPDVRVLKYNQTIDLQHITKKTAAVFVEGIQGEAGYLPPCTAYMQALRQRCTDVGVLLVFDEIQSGLGRTGKWFSYMHYGVRPDMVLLAKGLGGGLPIGALVASKAVMQAFKTNPFLGHITTFGGNAVCCAAALSVLQVIENEHLMQSIDAKEQLFRKLLKHPRIVRITGKGLMLGVDVGSFERVQKVIKKCLEKGVITDWFLFNNRALRICPPLIIDNEAIHYACQAIVDSLNEIE
jgi:acetylornithine/succinyldiaminopimelate/putrescine aminotransferase